MKKYLVSMIIVLCLLMSSICFAGSNDSFVSKEKINTICTGSNGEKVQFIGNRYMKSEDGSATLQVKNKKTGKIDLTLDYTAQRSGPEFYTGYSIDKMILSKKTVWVVTAYDDGPRYHRNNRIWVIGEYSGKYVVFLKEDIFEEINLIRAEIGSFATGPCVGGDEPGKLAIIFTNGDGYNEQRIAAYWDEDANWFGYTNVDDLPYGASVYSYNHWRSIK